MQRSFLKFLIIPLVVVSFILPAIASAQTPIDLVLQRVRSKLEEEIGRSDFAIAEYTYSSRTWQDQSLGCPAPGRTYTQEEIQGYSWDLTISFGSGPQTFEIHSDLNGEQVVICTPINRAELLSYRTFQNNEFFIDYPSTWMAVTDAPGHDVGIFPTGVELCISPGMTIDRVDGIVTASGMVNEAIQASGFVQNLSTNTPIDQGNGITVTFQTLCDDIFVDYRISAYPNAGGETGYLIRQWAPTEDFSSWDPVYLSMLGTFTRVSDLANATPETTSEASTDNSSTVPTGDLDPYRVLGGYTLAHSFFNDLYLSTIDDLPGVRITRNEDDQTGLTFSPNGRILAYIEPSGDAGEYRLMVVNQENARSIIAENVSPYYPPVWSLDSAQLTFIREESQSLEIYQIPVDGDTETELGTISLEDECEIPEAIGINDQLYFEENGFNGNAAIFASLPDGRYLLTLDCLGTNLVYWDPYGELSDVNAADGTELTRLALSPDKTQLAGISEEEVLNIIDTATGEAREVELQFLPDQMAWSYDNNQLYYSRLDIVDLVNLRDPELETRGNRLLGVYPYRSVLNTVSINSLNLNTGISTLLWEKQGSAIGRIVPVPNGVGVLFSFITSDREFVSGVEKNFPYNELRFLLPETEIYWIGPGGGEAELLLFSQQPLLSPEIVNQ